MCTGRWEWREDQRASCSTNHRSTHGPVWLSMLVVCEGMTGRWQLLVLSFGRTHTFLSVRSDLCIGGWEGRGCRSASPDWGETWWVSLLTPLVCAWAMWWAWWLGVVARLLKEALMGRCLLTFYHHHPPVEIPPRRPTTAVTPSFPVLYTSRTLINATMCFQMGPSMFATPPSHPKLSSPLLLHTPLYMVLDYQGWAQLGQILPHTNHPCCLQQGGK